MRILHPLALLSAGAALGLTGCTLPDTEPEPDTEPLPLASSFEVTARLSVEPTEGHFILPDTESILLRLDDAADGNVTAVLASSFDSASGSFARTRAGISLRAPIELFIAPSDQGVFNAKLTFESMELAPIDQDGDQRADAVQGSGSGHYSFLGDLVGYDLAFTVEILGSLDSTPPDLFLGATEQLHVLDGLTLLSTEPLRPGTGVQVRAGGTTINLTPYPIGASHVTSFETRKILPFDTEMVVAIDPTPKDLAGFEATVALQRILTMPDPGIFAEDGFEGDLAAVASRVEVVDGIGALPPIGGTRSLLIEIRSRLTMRVPLQEGDTHLRFEVRQLSVYPGGYDCVDSAIRLGFPALDRIETVSPVWNDDGLESTGDERWATAGAVMTVEVALPENAGNEVILDILPPPPLADYSCPGAMLLDNLRAE